MSDLNLERLGHFSRRQVDVVISILSNAILDAEFHDLLVPIRQSLNAFWTDENLREAWRRRRRRNRLMREYVKCGRLPIALEDRQALLAWMRANVSAETMGFLDDLLAGDAESPRK